METLKVWLTQEYATSPGDRVTAMMLCHADSGRPLEQSRPLGAHRWPFSPIFSLEAWSLSLIIQLLRVLKLFNRGLGHWVPVLSSSSHSWASSIVSDAWQSQASILLSELQSPTLKQATLSLLGSLHVRFSLPWISFFTLIIPIHPSGPGETSLYLESFPRSQSMLAQPVWFLYFFAPHSTCNLLALCLSSMNEAEVLACSVHHCFPRS